MTPERWRRIDALFHAALEREAGERSTFLAAACEGDGDLRQRVEALLNSLEAAGDFIEETPLAGVLASLIDASAATAGQSLTAALLGRRIGHYEIQTWLGAGGMGEVYRAHDLKLDRAVAIKILPTRFTQDEAQVQRFEREARAASALNHPNVVTIHEIGRDADTHFIAMEFVAGETLRERMAGGKLSVKESLRVAVQTAEALSAAHAAGLVHRDIKPENLMVRPDGLVKVLDFGLARPMARDSTHGAGYLPTAAAMRTDPDILMGTVGYLSPEQVLRQEIDHRADIFSLGVVLYEMVTGSRPFTGTRAAAICDQILHGAPAIKHSEIPAALQPVLSRALAKDRSARYQSAEQMRDALQRLMEVVADPRRGWFSSRRVRLAISFGVLALLAAPLSLLVRRQATPAAPFAAGPVTRITDAAGEEVFPSLAPDGQTIIYASRAAGNWDIYLQKVGEREALNLTADSPLDDMEPAFSPDGTRIAFYSSREGRGIFLMDSNGQNLSRLSADGHHPAWSPDGREIALVEDRVFDYETRSTIKSRMFAINVENGARRVITESDAVQPNWSPRGHRIAFWGVHKGGQRDLWTVAAAGGEPVAVTDDEFVDWNPVWSPDGRYLYFLSDRGGSMNLWRILVEERSGKPQGVPEPIITPSASCQHLSFSRDGRKLAYVQVIKRENLCQVSFDPAKEEVIGRPQPVSQVSRRETNPDLSPDGEWFVIASQDETQEDLFLIKRDGTLRRQLTNDRYKDRLPRWSPDGKKIAFYSDRSGRYEIWLMNPDGSGLEQLTHTPGGGFVMFPTWSPDGTRIAYRMLGSSPLIIEVGKSWAEQTPQALPALSDPGYRFGTWDWSPDGQRLAGNRGNDEVSQAGIVLYSFALRQFERLTTFGTRPVWLSDNRRLLFLYLDKIYLIDSRTRKTKEVLTAAPDDFSGYGIAPDDRALYFSLGVTEADIWLLHLQ